MRRTHSLLRRSCSLLLFCWAASPAVISLRFSWLARSAQSPAWAGQTVKRQMTPIRTHSRNTAVPAVLEAFRFETSKKQVLLDILWSSHGQDAHVTFLPTAT